jgi:tRNA (cmo5U34)-methyltransferase
MSSSPKDTLFQIDSVPEDFEFSERVVEVFDDMLDRSIPYYKEVIVSSAKLLDSFLQSGDEVIDLGCATGTTLLELTRLLAHKNLHFTGVDNSEAMLEKARLKAELFSKQDHLQFTTEDVTEIDFQGAGAFILNYTLQFIRPMKRESFLTHLHDNLRPGGILILSEKNISHDKMLNRKFIQIYHDFKRCKGYSELEIAKKREALENVLIPFSISENSTILQKAGFTSIEPFFQWFNFVSIVAVKAE